jgi:hypothetical protein
MNLDTKFGRLFTDNDKGAAMGNRVSTPPHRSEEFTRAWAQFANEHPELSVRVRKFIDNQKGEDEKWKEDTTQSWRPS